MTKGKITVLKRMANPDIADEYMKDESGADNVVPCPYLEDGQEFIIENWGIIPDGFCSWAWMDIHKGVMLVMGGGSSPSVKHEGMMIVCCSDGFRPVVFKIERIED